MGDVLVLVSSDSLIKQSPCFYLLRVYRVLCLPYTFI